jgi:hypothetical protein
MFGVSSHRCRGSSESTVIYAKNRELTLYELAGILRTMFYR